MKSGKRGNRPSLLERLLGRSGRNKGKSRRPAGRDAREPVRQAQPASVPAGRRTAVQGRQSIRPLTPRQRSIEEIRQLARIGARDPGRLARLLAAMLAKEQARRQADQERFDQQVREVVQRGRTDGDDRRIPGDAVTR